MSSSLLDSHDFDSGAQIDQVHPRTITNLADYKMGGMNTFPQTGASVQVAVEVVLHSKNLCGGLHLENHCYIFQVKWVLEGPDVLAGRKSLCQLLERFAERQGFSTSSLCRMKPWGWHPPKTKVKDTLGCDELKQQSQGGSPEEGEVEDGGMDCQKQEEKQPCQGSNVSTCKPFASEKALADLVLPCLVRSSNDTCSGFAFELVKQMSNLEQQISSISQPSGRAALNVAPCGDGILGPKGSGGRWGGRSGLDVGSPGLGRRSTASVSESTRPTAAALQISLWLRLQFLLPLLPMIQTER
jgi:hypothetical protein